MNITKVPRPKSLRPKIDFTYTRRTMANTNIEHTIKAYFDEKKHFPNDSGVDIELNAMDWLINDLTVVLIKKYYPYAKCELDLNDKDLKEFKNRTLWLCFKDNVLDYKKMLTDNRNHIGKDVLTSLLKLNGKN